MTNKLDCKAQMGKNKSVREHFSRYCTVIHLFVSTELLTITLLPLLLYTERRWPGDAIEQGKLPLPGLPTNFADSRGRPIVLAVGGVA